MTTEKKTMEKVKPRFRICFNVDSLDYGDICEWYGYPYLLWLNREAYDIYCQYATDYYTRHL